MDLTLHRRPHIHCTDPYIFVCECMHLILQLKAPFNQRFKNQTGQANSTAWPVNRALVQSSFTQEPTCYQNRLKT